MTVIGGEAEYDPYKVVEPCLEPASPPILFLTYNYRLAYIAPLYVIG